MNLQDTGTTMAREAARTRNLLALTTDGFVRNVAVVSKQLGPAAILSGATTAVEQWADAMGWLLKAQRQYVGGLAATATAMSRNARPAAPGTITPAAGAVGVEPLRRDSHSPRAETEAARRMNIRKAEEQRAAELEAERDALIAQAKLEQSERDRALAKQEAAEQVAKASAEREAAEQERVELEEAARAEEAERERLHVSRNLARQEARKAAKAEADSAAKAEAAKVAAREAAEDTAREEVASKKAAQAERAAARAKARQAARGAYVGRPKAKLVEELVGRGLPKSGNVVDLIERLVDADVA